MDDSLPSLFFHLDVLVIDAWVTLKRFTLQRFSLQKVRINSLIAEPELQICRLMNIHGA